MNKVKNLTYGFLKQFRISDINTENIMAAMSQQGYTVVEYSRISNSADVEQLLSALGLTQFSKTTYAFTYADGNNRIVFISEGLSHEEQLVLLTHEEGHIFCGHMASMSGICGEDILNEHEANTFAHYLLNNNIFRSLKLSIILNKIRAVWILTIILTFIAVTGFTTAHFASIPAFTKNVPTQSKFSDNIYCITPSGNKYHKPTCPYVIGHALTYGTAAEFKAEGKTPCKICIGSSEIKNKDDKAK
ncbi:MAG: ImmA/IrrE family metallo-endopeptidase [Bacillota bacterium]|nr:ImmA/IrrE family metallo-endopeptidase [Bacillota bacterium]